MFFHEDEEKDKEVGEISEDALDEVLEEEDDDEEDDPLMAGDGEEKDWA